MQAGDLTRLTELIGGGGCGCGVGGSSAAVVAAQPLRSPGQILDQNCHR